MANAPASNAYRIVEVPEPMKAMQDRFGREGSYVGSLR